MSSTAELQAAIAERLAAGASIDDVDRELLDAADVAEPLKDALWLFAWSLQPIATQRSAALDYLAALESIAAG